MGMFYGSMTHSYSGKKRKTNAYKTAPRKRTKFVSKSSSLEVSNPRMAEINAHRERYPSYVSDKPLGGTCGVSKDTSWKIEESKNFTVAPAYNKGAYQVINKGNIKDIGK